MNETEKQKTIFEKIISRDIPADIIFEDEKHIVFLDIKPFEKGHTLVIPKKPYETMLDMPKDEYMELQGLVQEMATKTYSELGGGFNICQNNYKIANQEVPHVHVHIIPRSEEKEMYHPENHTAYESEEDKKSFVEKLKLG